ncbi:MAG: tagaturonate epimerase family protein [Planctomycetaceae bacterium]|nr:hypothetical protein [Planctomycetaceae bacterium]
MLTLEKYSFGVGDRFGHQARAQLRAFELLAESGVDVVPVWNKSNREHTFVGSHPRSVRAAAQEAITERGWKKSWYVDADHIQTSTVEPFLECSNFFTIDVASSIGQPAAPADVAAFVARHPELTGAVAVSGLEHSLEVSAEEVQRIARQYLLAVQSAAETYRHIVERKGSGTFIPEVSMDETDLPQTPLELLVILAAFADEQVPLQTFAPKFTGRFNKGVDYVGDLDRFEREFNDDLAVLAHAIQVYGLPTNLKLSVHSGSDKFSLYPIIRRALDRTGAGIHVKTAGTTWLEEMIGLAEAGGDGLALAREIYAYSLEHVDELCAPYASVIDIDRTRLPAVSTVASWTGPEFAKSLRHIPTEPRFNPHMRQLLHVSFKVAAKSGSRYTDLLKANEAIVSEQVTQNLFERHLNPLFS